MRNGLYPGVVYSRHLGSTWVFHKLDKMGKIVKLASVALLHENIKDQQQNISIMSSED